MFDLDQATKDAVRTDLQDYEPAKNRLSSRVVLKWLYHACADLIAVGAQFDILKRHVFYGKSVDFPVFGGEVGSDDQARRAQDVIRLLHGVMGLVTEAAEAMEPIAAHIFEGISLDPVNLAEELGDTTWYLRLLADELPQPLAKIIETNVTKLRARYPEKFTEDAALNRDLAIERKILEGGK